MKASRFFGLVVVLTLLITLSQTMVRDSGTGLSAGTAFTVNAYDAVGNESGQSQGVLGFGEEAQGAAINAASCERSDVQAAIDAASDGDTVLVPAGTCTWTTCVNIDEKQIEVIGAGIDETIIIDGTAEHSSDGNYSMMNISTPEDKFFRLSGFTFKDVNTPNAIGIGGPGREWRIDHCKFTAASRGVGITISGYTYGVIDNCTFVNRRLLPHRDFDGWERPSSFGTADALYIEDCQFLYNVFGNCIDSHYGSRFVFRHNYIENTYVEIHGTGHDPSTFSFEIYKNTFARTADAGSYTYHLVFIRGGTGVVWGNRVNDSCSWGYNSIRVQNESSCNGECSSYPCSHQIGRTYDSDKDGVDDLWPMCEWDNSRNGEDIDIVLNSSDPCCTDYIKEGRDYYNDTPKPDYTPYTYPHPLRGESLVLRATPADQAIHLSWTVNTTLPVTSTWQIAYDGPVGDQPSPISGIISPTRAYTLTGLTNYTWYTVTLNAMLDSTPFLTDTVRVMPSDIFVYLPLIMRAYGP